MNEGRLSMAAVRRYLGDLQQEIVKLEQRLLSLRSASNSGTAFRAGRRRPGRPPAAESAKPAGGGGRRRRRGGPLSAQQRASRQLQGRYLGLIRQIPATRRAQYTRIAKERGREAAIREMQSVLNK